MNYQYKRALENVHNMTVPVGGKTPRYSGFREYPDSFTFCTLYCVNWILNRQNILTINLYSVTPSNKIKHLLFLIKTKKKISCRYLWHSKLWSSASCLTSLYTCLELAWSPAVANWSNKEKHTPVYVRSHNLHCRSGQKNLRNSVIWARAQSE